MRTYKSIFFSLVICLLSFSVCHATLSAGDRHSAYLDDEGNLWTWGENYFGQLGDGTAVASNKPVSIPSTNDWSQVSAEGRHTLALRVDGTLWAWGRNSEGQLGDGTIIDRTVPVQIGTDNDWSHVFAGRYYSHALKTDGTLWAWGRNSGALGDGTTIDCFVPVQIGTDNDWSQVSESAQHSLALKTDGTLWVWGLNSDGQLGDGTTINQTIPIQIGVDNDWVQVSVGVYHSLALKTDGTLWAWGLNSEGQLGDGTTTAHLVPIQIGFGNDWTQVTAAGSFYGCFSLAQKNDGTFWSWGQNSAGQLGDGTNIERHEPTQILSFIKMVPWSMYGHDAQHTGQSNFSGPENPFLKWHYQVGEDTRSPPVIGNDGTVYVGSLDDYLYAIKTDGTLKWRYQTGSYVSSSPAISHDGTVYVGSSDGYLYAIKTDGTLKWRYQAGVAIASSPAIGTDGTVYFSCYNFLYAINADGTLKWRYQPSTNIINSPAIGADGVVCFATYEGYLYAINPDGTLKWSYQTSIYPIRSSPSIGTDGTIYIGSDSNFLYAINSSGTLKWSYLTRGPVRTASAIGSDGTIYVQPDANYLYAINPDGTLKWSSSANSEFSPCIDSNGVIYTGNHIYGDTSEIFAFNPDGTRKWSYFINGYTNSPILGLNGTVLVGVSDGQLYALTDFSGVTGTVVDLATNSLVSYVTVSTNSGESVQSDSEGYYQLGWLAPGVYNLTFSRTGYQTITIDNVVVQEGQATTLDAYLTTPGILNITSSAPLPPAETGNTYNERVMITGGTYPYTFSVAFGQLPPGLAIEPTFGNIVGTPTTPGNYTFNIGVQDSQGVYAEREFSIEVTQPLAFETDSILSRGTRYQAYSVSLEASGGSPPYTFVRTAGTLPTGITLYSDGRLAGTPNSTGASTFTVRVTDSSGRVLTQQYTIEVDSALLLSTTHLNNGIVDTAYTQELTATGGYGTYHWRVYAGQLPDGIVLNSNGQLTGTPTRATNGTIVLSVTDDYGRTQFKDLNFLVVDPLTFITSSLPTGLTGAGYSELIVTRGGVGPFSYSYEGQLPAGLTLNTTTGIISGTPTSGGYVNVIVHVTDSTWPTSQTVSQTMGIRTTSLLTVTTSAVLPSVKKGDTITPITLSAGGGASPYSWTVASGYLPAGVTLDSTTGTLSGTAAAGGDYIFTLRVTDTTDYSSEKEFFFTVYPDLTINTNVIPSGGVGKAYYAILNAKGGKAPYSWRLISGTLPTGLTLSSDGRITGTPTARQSFQFTVEVSDADSPAQAVQKTYSIETYDDLFIETTGLLNGRIDEAYTTTIHASLGVPPYSFSISQGVLPPGLSFDSTNESATISGIPTTPGDYNFTVEVSDNGTPVATSSVSYNITIYGDLTIDTPGLHSALRGQYYSDTILVSGGALPYTWDVVAGELPAGLSLNRATGAITGITQLVEGQSSTFTIRVTEGAYPYGTVEQSFVIYVITPITIETTTIQNAMQNLAYSATLTGSGGISPYTWSVNAGNLPPGINLGSTTGTIAGTPTWCGPYDFTVNLADSLQLPNTTNRAYHIDVICQNQTDYDQDGMPNSFETTYSFDPYDPDDADLDTDSDNLTNLEEYLLGTDPRNADTDGDGVNDDTDLHPLTPDYPDYDLNSDGSDDILLRNSTNGAWRIFTMNNMVPSSQASLALWANQGWVYQDMADYDGDGDADILLRNSTTGEWRLFIVQNGAIERNFTPNLWRNQDYTLQSSADFDGDGDADILLRHTSSGFYRLFIVEDGAIVSSHTLATLWRNTTWAYAGAADFDNDGDADILLRNSDTGAWRAFTVEHGNITGSYGFNAWKSLTWTLQGIADYDKDGDADLLMRDINGYWQIFEVQDGQVAGSSVLSVWANPAWVTQSAQHDLDGDGDADILLRSINTGLWRSFTIEDLSIIENGQPFIWANQDWMMQ